MMLLGKALDKSLLPVQVGKTAGDTLALVCEKGLSGLPVVDKNHKLLGMVFKSELEKVPEDTPLVKF